MTSAKGPPDHAHQNHWSSPVRIVCLCAELCDLFVHCVCFYVNVQFVAVWPHWSKSHSLWPISFVCNIISLWTCVWVELFETTTPPSVVVQIYLHKIVISRVYGGRDINTINISCSTITNKHSARRNDIKIEIERERVNQQTKQNPSVIYWNVREHKWIVIRAKQQQNCLSVTKVFIRLSCKDTRKKKYK